MSMNAIRIRTTIESETLHLPQLKELIGQTAEIIVLTEGSHTGLRPGTGDWGAAAHAAKELTGYDFEAWREQREYDRKHASEHLP